MRYLLFVLVPLCTACSTVSELDPAETAFHALNFYDAGQTITIARSPDCFYERGFPTQEIAGRHPDQGEVALLFLAYSAGFHLANRWADEHPQYDRTRDVINWILVGLKASTIKDNHDQGIDPFTSCSR